MRPFAMSKANRKREPGEHADLRSDKSGVRFDRFHRRNGSIRSIFEKALARMSAKRIAPTAKAARIHCLEVRILEIFHVEQLLTARQFLSFVSYSSLDWHLQARRSDR